MTLIRSVRHLSKKENVLYDMVWLMVEVPVLHNLE